MRTMQFLEITTDPRVQRLLQQVVVLLKARLSVPAVGVAVGIGVLAWTIQGVRLRGIRLLLWMLVPLFIVAASICIGGPDRLFDKEAHEGRVVLQLTRNDAVTMLDIVGLAFATLGVLLAIALITWRVRIPPHEPVA